MPEPDLLTTTAADGRDLLAAAEADWSRPIPHCPDWDAWNGRDSRPWPRKQIIAAPGGSYGGS